MSEEQGSAGPEVVDLSPDIDGERCVHGLSPIAQCRACVAACPPGAITLDEDGLKIDAAACDGCGVCIAACPQEAIALQRMAVLKIHDRDDVPAVHAACERLVPPGAPGFVPCLHALSAAELAGLYRRGARQLVVASEDCARCPRQARPGLDERHQVVARLLADRGLEPLKLERLAGKAWAKDREEAARPNRRALFRAVLGRGAETHDAGTTVLAGDTDGAAPRGAGAILPGRASAHIAESEPVIEARTCTACGACVEVCPHAAVILHKAGEGAPAYVIDATACTGCGLCVNSCDVGVISLVAWGRAHPAPVPLAEARCSGCGAPYLYVVDGPVGADLCRICSRTHHRKTLFQVLP